MLTTLANKSDRHSLTAREIKVDTPTVTDFWKEWSLTGSAGQGVSGRVTKARGSAKVVTRTPSKHKAAVKRHKELVALKKVREKAGKTLTEGQQKRLDALAPTVKGKTWETTRTSIGARTKKKRAARTKWRKRERVKAIRSATAKKQREARAKKKATGAKPKARTRRKAK